MSPSLRPCDHFRGSPGDTVTLILYGDYQCSHSCQTYKTITHVLNQSPHPVCLVYRHFPRTPPQTSAWKAAEAAEAASAQGKFWEMHDLLYQHSEMLEDDKLVECAVQVGLDIPQFLKGLTNHIHTEQVEADIESGRSQAITAPPTILTLIYWQRTSALEPLLSKVLEIVELTRPDDSS